MAWTRKPAMPAATAVWWNRLKASLSRQKAEHTSRKKWNSSSTKITSAMTPASHMICKNRLWEWGAVMPL